MRRIILVFIGGLIMATFPFLMTSYWVGLMTQALIFGGFAVGLDILVGYTRMPSLGHAAFFGMAGYGLAIANTRWDIAPWPAAVIGIILAVAVAALFAPLAVRTRGLTFLTITLAFGQVVWGLVTRWTSFTGGENGIPGIPRPEQFLWNLDTVVGFYYFALLVWVVHMILATVFAGSAVGMSLLGVRNSDTRMVALGYNVQARRSIAFIFAAFSGALFGALNVFFNKFIGPGSLSWQLSAQMLLSVVIGGPASLWGPFIAGGGLVILKNTLIGSTQRWPIVLGALYVISVTVLPNGLVSLGPKIRGLFARRKVSQSHS
ncbi:MAG: branched-chain amino acid ABC transporter permease [Candidatus Promineifilaceae bacterium]|nr:branched-chain amino acid ABC transporter permease [Candidatus Promineifilaceae bacterium]